MAQFVTRKSIISRYISLSTSYCSLQNLFPQSIRCYYWAGLYGWNCDVHFVYLPKSIHGEYIVAVTTGYRPFGKTVDYKLVEKYDDLAKRFKEKYREFHSVDNQHKVLRYLRIRFVREALSK